MRVACLGGGPAGLYFAIAMKLRDPAHELHVFERNSKGVTFGWGVVFSDQTVANLQANDPVSARRSEEHTSELQSLMRISYAVFCLKKKNKQMYHRDRYK